MAERHGESTCPSCQAVAPYAISAPRVFCDFPAYISPASGNLIEGKRQRLEDFARTGTRPYESGERQEAEKARSRNEKALDQQIDKAVEQTIAETFK